MATRVFSEEELARLRGFPEITDAELVRFFTLTAADAEFVAAVRGRSPKDRLGLAVQLCTLPWLGFVPDDVAAAPAVAVDRLAHRLGVGAGELVGYGQREQTRTDHLRMVVRYLGWRTAGTVEWKELEEFLLARAMEHDSPTLLFRLACEHLISGQVLRPGPVSLIERVAAARAAAERETYQRVAHLLSGHRPDELDRLLEVDPEFGGTRLAWLGRGPTEPSPAAVKAELGKLWFLRSLDAHTLDLSMLPAERRRFLAAVGRRLTPQALQRRDPHRRHPILLTLLAQSAVDVLDEVVQLFDQAVSGRESRARRRMTEALAERARSGEDRQVLLGDLLAVVTDTAIPDEDVGGLLRGERIGWDRLRAAMATAPPRLPRDHGHLAMLDSSYSYLRQFTPQVLGAITFVGGPTATAQLEAVEVLRGLNATGARKVPDGAPTDFVPTRWRGYLDTATATGDISGYRHYWELCVLLALRDGLRSGDVFVPGSRRYADPTVYLLPRPAWETQRGEFCALVGKPADPHAALARAQDELSAALDGLEQTLANGGEGGVRLDEAGELVIPPLTAEDLPAETDALRAELGALVPPVPIASLLVELDRRTGFLDCFTHAGGRAPRSTHLKRNLLAVIIAGATNLGLVRMAQASLISYDTLAWTAEWYVREETLRASNLAITGYHQQLPLTAIFGGETLSSSEATLPHPR